MFSLITVGFGVTLYHVMFDSGLLDTLQLSQPGSVAVGWLVLRATSGASEISALEKAYK